MTVSRPVRTRIRVRGVVQGVGFRPFVYGLANELGLAGHVGNDGDGVFIEAQGSPDAIEALIAAVQQRPPTLATVDSVRAEAMPVVDDEGFVITASVPGTDAQALVPPDTATCTHCLSELFDPTDRRFRYPFINCTRCGPRFTIVTGIPYDRANTTMAGFTMCAACAAEYDDPLDRRFHAQPNCCAGCGPRLSIAGGATDPTADPVADTVRLLREGAVVAVKGLGGYHLAVDASNESAVSALRARKHREDKPFAVLCADADTVGTIAVADATERDLLSGPARPIVLLRRRERAALAADLAPGTRLVGVMLPYTPLHHLLARDFGRPLVLTSGNVSDEPIAFEDDDARARLADIADAFLVSDRAIHIRTDDSVTRVVRGAAVPIRRSRGFAPDPIRLPWQARRPVLGCGAELKSTFCLLRGAQAFVSHHIGDLENYETLRSFSEGVAHYSRLFATVPAVVAHDLHPDYLSTKWALDLDDVELVGVQHHHAHIASCLADNGRNDQVLGVAFDGTGFGTDATLWGGEFLIADLREFERVGHLAAVPVPGGAAAIREPWRMAVAYLLRAYDGAPPDDVDLVIRHAGEWPRVEALVLAGVNSPASSGAGRLFDAVAAIAGVRDRVNYEGQAAIEMEQLVDLHERGSYAARLETGPPLLLHGSDLVRAAADDLRNGVTPSRVATRFHRGLADAVVTAGAHLAAQAGLRTVALSGGVFQNVVLLDLVADAFEARGLEVLTHHRVPANDGGISLGQAVVAATRDGASVC